MRDRRWIVALAVVAVAMVVIGFVRLRYLLATALALAVLVISIVPDYALRVRSLGAADTATAVDSRADASIRGRATENLAAVATFRDHPFLGAGPGGFFRRYSQEEANKLGLRFLGKNRRAHNMYLEMSKNAYTVDGQASPWITVPHSEGWYAANRCFQDETGAWVGWLEEPNRADVGPDSHVVTANEWRGPESDAIGTIGVGFS